MVYFGRLSKRFERKITGESGQKLPKFNSKLLKDVKKIEKHFEDAEIIQLNAKVRIQSMLELAIVEPAISVRMGTI